MNRLLLRLKCWIVGHRYKVRQVFTPETRRVGCTCCDGDWAMNDRERIIVPWSGEFEAFYSGEIFAHIKATQGGKEGEA